MNVMIEFSRKLQGFSAMCDISYASLDVGQVASTRELNLSVHRRPAIIAGPRIQGIRQAMHKS
jgi:hypothetical protein